MVWYGSIIQGKQCGTVFFLPINEISMNFQDFHFDKISHLPRYLFTEISDLKLQLRRQGRDIIDMGMGNPDQPPPRHIIDKLIEVAQKPKSNRYSMSRGIPKLRLAISRWYDRRFHVKINFEKEAIVTMGSKEGYVHLVQAMTNPGDYAIVVEPAYPIHTYALMLTGVNSIPLPISWNNHYELDQERFFERLSKILSTAEKKPKFIVVNFPHNPTTVTVTKDFYVHLVAFAKKAQIYIISDIAYAELTFDGYKTPSIMEVEGAKEVAVESYTLSKTYNMAGWRVGFMVGNPQLIGLLQKMKGWIDYGAYLPIQVAATVALNASQESVLEISSIYRSRRDTLIQSFSKVGWNIPTPNASMFVWAKIPQTKRCLGSMEFSKQLLYQADLAVSPGLGFGKHGEGYVRLALIENEKRIRQAAKNLKNIF